jgi:hypothetical protein
MSSGPVFSAIARLNSNHLFGLVHSALPHGTVAVVKRCPQTRQGNSGCRIVAIAHFMHTKGGPTAT